MSTEQRLTDIEAALDTDPSPVIECVIDGMTVKTDRKRLIEERDGLRREIARKAGRRPQCATINLSHG